MKTRSNRNIVYSLVTMAGCFTLSANLVNAGEIIPITAMSSSSGGDRYANGMVSLTDGSGIHTSPDPEEPDTSGVDPADPSTWMFDGGAYQDELMSWFFKDGDGEPTTGLNSKLAWDSFDLGEPTGLETLYLFNNNYQGGISGVDTYNLYYADSPTVALPAQPNKNTYSNTGLTPAGDYDFSSGGWSKFNTSALTAPKAGIATVDLTGISARYIAIEILTNHGDTYLGGRVGLDEVAITGTGTAAPALPFAITEIDYDAGTDMVVLTWRSQPGETYTVKYSSEMTDWDPDIVDSITMEEHDENPNDGNHLTVSLDLAAFDPEVAARSTLMFRVEK